MNKYALIISPIIVSALVFMFSAGDFARKGIPLEKPETVEYVALSEKGKALLDQELMNPIKSRLGGKVKTESFSRCPSGLRHFVEKAPESDDPYFYGIVVNRQGCREKEICAFRIDAKEEKVEARSGDAAEFVSAAEWRKNSKNETWDF